MIIPKWQLELEKFNSLKTTFILEGNIYDLQPYYKENEEIRLITLDNYLYNYLKNKGYEDIVFYNHVDGFYNNFSIEELNNFLKLINKSNHSKDNTFEASIDKATEYIRIALENREKPIAIVMNQASRYVTNPSSLSEEENKFYSRLFLTTLKPTQNKSIFKDTRLYNGLYITCNKANDIPYWFYLENPQVKILNITKPDKNIRKNFINNNIKALSEGLDLKKDELIKHKEKFIDLTEGLSNLELKFLRTLMLQEKITIDKVDRAITVFKYGIKENPWSNIGEEKLKNSEEFIKSRVKGQQVAINQTLDIIKRATSGMSGLNHSGESNKPKGILFFAGPTGTGKTELAKTLANLLFGDDNSCIRFDMSEYQQPHSDQKLLGAPPGYVGYEAGGQLTNAVKEKPFSILLFDEIEKAHPSILDKFLQILEDGRMTDGSGETVYFSESIIIFTSNLGIYSTDEIGNRKKEVRQDMNYEEIKEKVLQGVKDYFIYRLGRPEILNRLGDNIVVFDFIRSNVANEILSAQLNKINKNIKENKRIIITLEDNVFKKLSKLCEKNLENGGRGIGNIVEKYYINPLARYIYDEGIKENEEVIVKDILEEEYIISLKCDTGLR